jgi:hypothetical protein
VSRPVSLGYLIPPGDAITSKPDSWVVTPSGGTPLANPEGVDNWQYATNIKIEKAIEVDLPRVLDAVNLGPQDEIRGVLVASSSATGIQRSSEPTALRDGENTLSLQLIGSECGGQLRLRILISSGAVSGTPRLAPHRAGSVLWSEEHRVFLEGDQTRFPTEIVSFASYPTAPASAAWCVEIDTSDLAAPALGCVRLLLNSDHPAYDRLRGVPDAPEAIRTREFLRFDVARQLVTAALMAEEFGAHEYEEGSLGWVLRARLSNYYGEAGDDVDSLRAWWRASPWECDADLQASFYL